MKTTITFRELNPDFDKEYALEYHDGEESENNRKWNRSTTIQIKDPIKDIKVAKKKSLDLDVLVKNKKRKITLQDLTVLECVSEDNSVHVFAVSNKILDKTHEVMNKKYNLLRFYFYFTPYSDFTDISNTIYVATEDLSKNIFNPPKR